MPLKLLRRIQASLLNKCRILFNFITGLICVTLIQFELISLKTVGLTFIKYCMYNLAVK